MRTNCSSVSLKTSFHRPGCSAFRGTMPAPFFSDAVCAPSSLSKSMTGENPSTAMLMRCSRASSSQKNNLEARNDKQY